MDDIQDILCLLRVDPENRKRDEQLRISQFLQSLKFFSDKKEKSIQAAVLGRLQYFKENKTVVKINTEGNLFFIILKGKVEIHAKSPNFSSDMTLQSVKQLEQGDSFGELSLIFDQKRLASVITKEECYFLTLTKQEYCEQFFKSEMTKMKNYVNFLYSIPLLKDLRFTQIQDIYLVCDEIVSQKGQILSEENQITEYIYFVFEGEFITYKTFEHSIQQNLPQNQNNGSKQNIDINQLDQFQVCKIGKFEILMCEAALSEERISSFKIECNSYRAVCLRIQIDDFYKRVLQYETCFDKLVKQVGLRNDRLVQQRNILMKSINKIQTYVLSDRNIKQLQLGQLGQQNYKFCLKKNDEPQKYYETQRERTQYLSSKTPISLSPRIDFIKENKSIITIQGNQSTQDQEKKRERVFISSFQKKMEEKKAYMTNLINTKRHVKPQNYLYEWRQKQQKIFQPKKANIFIPSNLQQQLQQQQHQQQQQLQQENVQQSLPSINQIQSLNNIQILSDLEEERNRYDQDIIKEFNFTNELTNSQSNPYLLPFSKTVTQSLDFQKIKNNKQLVLSIDTESTSNNTLNQKRNRLSPQNQQSPYQLQLTEKKGKSNSICSLLNIPSSNIQNQKRQSLNIFNMKPQQEDSTNNILSQTKYQDTQNQLYSVQSQTQFELNDPKTLYKGVGHLRSVSHVSLTTPINNNLDFSKNKRTSFYGLNLLSPMQQTISQKQTVISKEPKQFVEIDKKSFLEIIKDDKGKSASSNNNNNHKTSNQINQQIQNLNQKNNLEMNSFQNQSYKKRQSLKDSPLKTNIFLQGTKMKSPGKISVNQMNTTAAES
ncbi:hypothetical protein ABPG74_016013 [Tetrahymena malaccensis]